MNHIKKVAEMYGVKLGERFKIDGVVLRFTEKGLVDDKGGMWLSTIGHLIAGECVIEKIPWKPNVNDEYWLVRVDGETVPFIWYGNTMDLVLYYCGDCFKTREEAEKHVLEITEKLRKEYLK